MDIAKQISSSLSQRIVIAKVRLYYLVVHYAYIHHFHLPISDSMLFCALSLLGRWQVVGFRKTTGRICRP